MAFVKGFSSISITGLKNTELSGLPFRGKIMAVVNWLWAIVRSVANTIARMVVFALIAVVTLAIVGLTAGDGMPDTMVLELDLRQPMDDKAASPLFDLARGDISVMDVVLGLDVAARDPRVKGVFLRVGSGDLSVPKAEELRAALKRLRSAGKFVLAHSQSFYSDGLGDYSVAAAADEIWMQPGSAFFASGTASTTVFLRGLFDNIEAVPQFVQREEYKSAADIFMQTDFTAPHREATGRVLQSWYDTVIGEIAADRAMERDVLIGFLEQSPSTVDIVREQGLITAIGYDDDARDAALERAGENAELKPFGEYFHNAWERAGRLSLGSRGPVIAFIHAAGEIVQGGNGVIPTGTVNISGDRFAEAVRDATKDDNVQAILLRVDSPGGSAIASDQILDALKKAREAGKPVVVSMGTVAASGGYYISLAANRIFAHPGTLTGSIGVVWGKIAVGDSLALLGLRGAELSVGRNALFLSGLTPWDAGQMAEVEAQADAIYEDFTRKVAEGRNMPLPEVLEVARGRVWTGADAQVRGLVDELGGFWAAVDHAKELAGIDPDVQVVFREFPRRRNLFGRLSDLLNISAGALAALHGLNTLLGSPPVQAVVDAMQATQGAGAQFRALGLPNP